MLQVFQRPYADPVLYPLAAGPGPMLLIVSAYLLFVLKFGKQFMANRQPYQLRGIIQFYNVMQVLFNGSMMLRGLYYFAFQNPSDLSCMKTVPLDHPIKSTERFLSYLYYLNKYVDLLDTVFYVLRKNYHQITVLHLFHHAMMPSVGYLVIRFHGYGGHLAVLGELNTFVHMIMYAYYYLAARDKTLKQSLWWKKYLTIIQQLQFLALLAHSFWTLAQPNCDASRIIIYLESMMATTMLVMFTNFYIHAYILPNKKRKQM